MQILSKLSAATVLAGIAAAQGPSVYIAPGTASYLPGTFGQTFSDGSYISAGVPRGAQQFQGNFQNGHYDDISYAAQNGVPAANTNLQFQGFPPPSFNSFPPPNYNNFPPQGYNGGFNGEYNDQSYDAPAPPPQGLTPPPPPIYSAGTGGLSPPPPPIYSAGVGVSDGNLPSVTVGGVTHTGGFKHQKREVNTKAAYPYYGYPRSYGWNYPTVSVGLPNAYFAPGTFGTTFSDGGYVSAGVPRGYPWKQSKLNKRQTVSAQPAGPYGPTVSVGAPTASFLPGTFGQTFSDGGYTSWGVPDAAQIAAMQAQYGGYAYGPQAAYAPQPYSPYGVPAYGPAPYHAKREVATPSAAELSVDGSSSNLIPTKLTGYASAGFDSVYKDPRKSADFHRPQQNQGAPCFRGMCY